MTHDNFQPPEFDAPELDDDDRMHGALTELASIDTYDTNLRDQPAAYEILDRLMQHGYAEGRKDAAAVITDLVSALNSMLTYFGMDEDEWSKPVFDKARAAIAEAA